MYQKIWRRFLPKHPEENTKENWDKAYLSGYWDRLHSISEVPHLAVVAGYYKAIRGNGNILDVGCGEGLLLNYLDISKGEKYLGVDISQVAIERAATRISENIYFKIIDIEEATLSEKYSIIVLNECACYFTNLMKVIRMLKDSLRENGHVIVSLYISPQTRPIWRTLEAEMKIIDSVQLKGMTGSRWRVGLFTVG